MATISKKLIHELRTAIPAGRICQRGLAQGEAAVTLVHLAGGKVVTCMDHNGGRAVANLRRRHPQAVELVEHVIRTDNGHGETVRTVGTFNLVGLDLIPVVEG